MHTTVTTNGHANGVTEKPAHSATLPAELRRGDSNDRAVAQARNMLLTFKHGLGDAVQLTVVLKHLHQLRPAWNVDVETLVGKHSAFQGLCRKVYVIAGWPRLAALSLPGWRSQKRFFYVQVAVKIRP